MVSENKTIQEYYQALLDRDSQYLGVFFVGVKTTNVFCIATCRARKPKKENVIFYSSAEEALLHGYRPCKVCKPTENVHEPPDDVRQLVQLVNENPFKKIGDADIRQLGIQPEKIRRWFKTHHNITFQAYQRMIRINMAYEQLKKGKNVTTTAFEAGYESLSGFGYTFKNLLNGSPELAENLNTITLHRFTTPLGPMYAGSTENGLCLLEFTDRKMLETEFKDLSRRLNAKIIVGQNEFTKRAQIEITEYFEGKRSEFSVPLVTPGTEFQIKVWDELQRIPLGKTRSYKDQAIALGNKEAVRAVARANGNNRIAIIIPCHRIIGSNGELTGYAGGLARKKWLLEHESKQLGLQF